MKDIPIGTIVRFYPIDSASDFVRLDGSAISRKRYKDLFALLGTKYGKGDGSTTFNVLDLSDGLGFFYSVKAKNTMKKKPSSRMSAKLSIIVGVIRQDQKSNERARQECMKNQDRESFMFYDGAAEAYERALNIIERVNNNK